MEIKKNITEPRAHEKSHEAKIVCSECGMEVKSSFDWIKGENGRALCIFCYKNHMFPNLDENYMEIFD
jgi:formylmethanofuran dehydrogenase subunit E